MKKLAGLLAVCFMCSMFSVSAFAGTKTVKGAKKGKAKVTAASTKLVKAKSKKKVK